MTPYTVGEIMTSPVVTVPASMPAEDRDALHLMRTKGIHSVIVEPDWTGRAVFMQYRKSHFACTWPVRDFM